MNRKLKLVSVTLLLALLAGVAVAAVYQTRQINTTVFVQGNWDFQLYTDISCTNVWTAQNWGTLARGESVQSEVKYAKNIGGDPIYVEWSAVVPTGFTLTCTWGITDNPWAQNTCIGPYSKITGDYSFLFRFTLTATSNAPAGTTNIQITFSCADSSSG